jgi:hypothetical protein
MHDTAHDPYEGIETEEERQAVYRKLLSKYEEESGLYAEAVKEAARRKEQIREQLRGDLKGYRKIQLEDDDRFSKNIVTLAAGAFGVSFAFIDRIIPFHASGYKFVLAASWASFALTLVFSILIHLVSSFIHGAYYDDVERAIVSLDNDKPLVLKKHWYSRWVMDVFYILAFIGFLSGISCLVLFVFLNS